MTELKIETEALLCVAQDQTLSTNKTMQDIKFHPVDCTETTCSMLAASEAQLPVAP